MYRGVGSALVGSAPGAALFFVTYDGVKRVVDGTIAEGKVGLGLGLPTRSRWVEPLVHMVAASLGEVAACAVRVPTEVVKQRAQAGLHGSSLAALGDILGRYGRIGVAGVWRELYRGWGVTVMREVPFTVVQFPLWEALKAWARNRKGGLGRNGEVDVTALESALFGSVAGAVAAGTTTPLDVLKTRLMLAREKVSALEMLRQILRDSGPRALFAGIGPRMLWISVGGAIFLGSYQWAINALGGHRAEE